MGANDYVHLVGAEDVAAAGHRIQESAEKIRSAADSIAFAVDRLITKLDEVGAVMERAVTPIVEMTPPPRPYPESCNDPNCTLMSPHVRHS